MDDKNMEGAERLRGNYNNMVARAQADKALGTENRFDSIANTKPLDTLKAIDALVVAAGKVEPDKNNPHNINDSDNTMDKRTDLWSSAQIAISKLKAPDAVKGELFHEFMEGQNKVRAGLGGGISLGGEPNRFDNAKLNEGVEDLKSFRESLKRADKKYGTMTPEEHKKWKETEIVPAKEMEMNRGENNLGALPSPAIAVAKEIGGAGLTGR